MRAHKRTASTPQPSGARRLTAEGYNYPGPLALDVVLTHVREWPRDALVLGTCASQIGLIGLSGLAGREQRLADLLDGVAPAFGDDWWFLAHHGMALSEVGRRAEARQKIARSRAMRVEDGFMAHAQAHMSYEEGDAGEAVAFMRGWLPGYPREGALFGHLSWHLALVELEMGEVTEAFGRYSDAIAAPDYPGQPIIKLADAASFLWRAELAGWPRDVGKWQEMLAFSRKMFPRAGIAIADWHVALVDAVAGDQEAIAARELEVAALAETGRYPSGSLVPSLARGLAAFARADFNTAIRLIEPVLTERERIGGSRAQTDLVEFTLLRAYAAAGRVDAIRGHLEGRRARSASIPVAELAGQHHAH